jgi:diaminopimelate epimerase
MKIKFRKYSGHGNDFIVIDQRIERFDLTADSFIKLSSRRFGIGGDGVIIIDHSFKDKDYSLRIYNMDGSEALMCGNAARISVAYNAEVMNKTSFEFDTKNSIYSGKFENGEAIIKMSELFDIDKYDISDLSVLGAMYLNTGVPHAVIQITDIENFDLETKGSLIRHDERFDGGTNVCFFEVVKSHEIKFRVFERGIEGETHCCGTGIIATAVTCKELFNWSGEIKVHCLGGEVRAIINEDLSDLQFAGKVDLCFEGTITL